MRAFGQYFGHPIILASSKLETRTIFGRKYLRKSFHGLLSRSPTSAVYSDSGTRVPLHERVLGYPVIYVSPLRYPSPHLSRGVRVEDLFGLGYPGTPTWTSARRVLGYPVNYVYPLRYPSPHLSRGVRVEDLFGLGYPGTPTWTGTQVPCDFRAPVAIPLTTPLKRCAC